MMNQNEPKMIRFIDPNYNTLFYLPDGEQILLSYSDGTKRAAVCQYIGSHHVKVGHNYFHICEFAELMKRNGTVVTPFPEKRKIWSNINLDIKDWLPSIREAYPDIVTRDENVLLDKMYTLNAAYLDDERMNLDIQCDDKIIVIADLGRWNGRFPGYKVIESGKISDCLYSDCDYTEWYVDREGEFRCTAIHHDGTNRYLYRKFKPDATEEDREDLLARLYDGDCEKVLLDHLTEKLGYTIGAVYGWQFPTEGGH